MSLYGLWPELWDERKEEYYLSYVYRIRNTQRAKAVFKHVLNSSVYYEVDCEWR